MQLNVKTKAAHEDQLESRHVLQILPRLDPALSRLLEFRALECGLPPTHLNQSALLAASTHHVVHSDTAHLSKVFKFFSFQMPYSMANVLGQKNPETSTAKIKNNTRIANAICSSHNGR